MSREIGYAPIATLGSAKVRVQSSRCSRRSPHWQDTVSILHSWMERSRRTPVFAPNGTRRIFRANRGLLREEKPQRGRRYFWMRSGIPPPDFGKINEPSGYRAPALYSASAYFYGPPRASRRIQRNLKVLARFAVVSSATRDASSFRVIVGKVKTNHENWRLFASDERGQFFSFRLLTLIIKSSSFGIYPVCTSAYFADQTNRQTRKTRVIANARESFQPLARSFSNRESEDSDLSESPLAARCCMPADLR